LIISLFFHFIIFIRLISFHFIAID
jgi:hypothetical protein